GELRSGPRVHGTWRTDAFRKFEPGQNCRSSEGGRILVRFPAARRLHPLLYLWRGRDESRALRSAGSGIGTGGGVPHRIQRLPILSILPCRIRQHAHCRGNGRNSVLGWLAAAFSECSATRLPLSHSRGSLVYRQSDCLPLLLPVVPGKLAAISI